MPSISSSVMPRTARTSEGGSSAMVVFVFVEFSGDFSKQTPEFDNCAITAGGPSWEVCIRPDFKLAEPRRLVTSELLRGD